MLIHTTPSSILHLRKLVGKEHCCGDEKSGGEVSWRGHQCSDSPRGNPLVLSHSQAAWILVAIAQVRKNGRHAPVSENGVVSKNCAVIDGRSLEQPSEYRLLKSAQAIRSLLLALATIYSCGVSHCSCTQQASTADRKAQDKGNYAEEASTSVLVALPQQATNLQLRRCHS